MKKNGQYVGVDEKYIPEEEKYVDNEVNSEIKGLINDGIKATRNYVSNKDNQEKMKKAGRKGIKILKGIGIGYLVFFGFIILMFITIFIFAFSTFFEVNKKSDDIFDKTTNIIQEGNSSYESTLFNSDLEMYNGTKYGTSVTKLLDVAVTKIKKYPNHPITVTYGEATSSTPDEIIALKKQFDGTIQYEISFNYDTNGFINEITIANY